MTLAELAERLDRAALTAAAVAQPADLEVGDAYLVQGLSIDRRRRRGERVVGIKMGFTSREKMRQMGIEETIWGRLTDAMRIPSGGTLPMARHIHPRAEPEIAFLLGRAPDPDEPAASLASAVEAVAPAIEIIDSRYEDFRFDLAGVIADNASSAAFVLGEWRPFSTGLAIAGLDVALELDGRVAESGSTAAILGDPLLALAAGVRLAARYGHPLTAGDVVLAGAATAAVPLREGVRVTARVEALGPVSFRAVAGDGS
ncbi:fumarylacetoacetate hydrolase family protein [Actinomadura viridis]|uniref:2-oxo-3-hexenedioate decarboxylase n=1 Tax=Actinomadura viridis TaxID=58110 RepID=A0A931DMY9_9ACTN|nr:fumarylacetoacetate hydrolase family protein [Actinomadura viridis]MBG6091513.1 2-oxo-3-hexenedioate decarboxylase [Actinomadura viridis]